MARCRFLLAILLAGMSPATWAQTPPRIDQPPPASVALAPIPEGKALLYLFNGSGRTVFSSKPTFKVDGQKALKLARHQYGTVAIDPGQHKLQVTNRKLSLDAQAGQYYFVMYAYHPDKSWGFPAAGDPDDLVALPEDRARELLETYSYSPGGSGTW